jgi:hypothetical protein
VTRNEWVSVLLSIWLHKEHSIQNYYCSE